MDFEDVFGFLDMSSCDRSPETAAEYITGEDAKNSFIDAGVGFDRCENSIPFVETACCSSISGDEDCEELSVNGMEGGYVVNCLDKINGCEDAVKNGIVAVQQGQKVALKMSSTMACSTSITCGRSSNANCFAGTTENGDELLVIPCDEMKDSCEVSGPCSNNCNGEELLFGLFRLDESENVMCENQVVLESQGQMLESEPCPEACPHPINGGQMAKDNPIGVYFNVDSENGDKPLIIGTNDGCGVPQSCLKESNAERLLCSSPKFNRCEDALKQDQVIPGQCQSCALEPSLEEACSVSANANVDTFDGPNGCNFDAASENGTERLVIFRNGTDDRCEDRSDLGRPLSSVGRNEAVHSPQAHVLVLQSCLELSCFSKGGNRHDMGSMDIFAVEQNGTIDERGVRNVEEKLGSSHQYDQLEVITTEKQIVLQSQNQCSESRACSERGNILISSNRGNLYGLDGFHANLASINGAEPLVAGRNGGENECGVSGLFSDDSSIEDRLCNLPKYGRRMDLSSSESDAGPLIAWKNEVEYDCGVNRNCSDMSKIENRICSPLKCNGCKNDAHGPKVSLPIAHVCSKMACPMADSNCVTLDGLDVLHFNVNDKEHSLNERNVTEVRSRGDELCPDESNMENYSWGSGRRQGLCLQKAGSMRIGGLGTSYDEVTPLVPSPNNWAEQNRHLETCVFGPSEKTCTNLHKVEEQKHLILESSGSASPIHKPFIEEKPCISREGPPDAASYCAHGESSSPQSSQLPDGLKLNCSKYLVPDTHERGTSCAVGPSRKAVRVGKFNVKLDNDSGSTHACKSIQLTRTRKSARQRRQALDTAGIFLSKAKGKRSSCKQTRSSIWGALSNVMQVFQKNCEILKFDSQLAQVKIQGSKKGRGGFGSRRCQKSQIKGSKAKCPTATNHSRSKVKKVGEGDKKSLETVLPDMVQSQALAQTVVPDCLLPLDSQVGFEKLKTAIEIKHELEGDSHGVGQFPCVVKNFEKLDLPLDVSVREAQIGDRDLESTVTQETSIENTSGDYPVISSLVGTDALGEAVDNRHIDPGTSPDSDVLNVLPDLSVSATESIKSVRRKVHSCARRGRNDFFAESGVPKSFLGSISSFKSLPAPGNVTPSSMKRTSRKKGKDICNGDMHQSVECSSVEEKLLGPAKLNNLKKSAKRRPARKVRDGFDLGNTLNATTSTNSSSKASNNEDAGISQSASCMPESLSSAGSVQGVKLPKKLKAGASKWKSQAPGSSRRRRGNEGGDKRTGKSKIKDMCASEQVLYKEENHTLASGIESGETDITGTGINLNIGRPYSGNKFTSDNILSSTMLSIGNDQKLSQSRHGSELQHLQPRRAWVRCDDCHKWRCISAELADKIEETDCRWTCKDNLDKAFADCLIPQEKSNAEINAELEISDASGEEGFCGAQPNSKGPEHRQLTASQQASWKLVKSNLFLHRNRRTQTIDEVMVCHCKRPSDGSLGCRDECLNRMLNIECLKGTCPCADLCSNRQFQKRKYAKFKWFRCGKKGYGLQLLEDVSCGAFLIEYVGEVLDLPTYESRQKEYAARGQKHFYFMTLNGSEVIDACAKGNLGRFINHSCDPNCRTEKWMVNGEVCIGLFAIRDIKKGEEVTFDYNYVRVFGAAAKKCVCGSSECRGYIGGDPSNTEAIVQGDSDEEYPEPVMVREDNEAERSMEDIISSTNLPDAIFVQHAVAFEAKEEVCKSLSDILEFEVSSQILESERKSPSAAQQMEISLQNVDSGRDVSLPVEDIVEKPLPSKQFESPLRIASAMRDSFPAIEQLEITSENTNAIGGAIQIENAVRDSFSAERLDASTQNANALGKSLASSEDNKSKSVTIGDKPNITKSCLLVKSSRSSASVKGKSSAVQVMANKPKKQVEGGGNNRFEGVEEKLNELLDADGGISKRKDATKGYLKLLFVTAASGDHVNGEAYQSTRDLSMILDALLKTKSRMVLIDIINKNGLQMLHNIMKQNRRNFSKIPIIRKLLKVLEFLALKEILTIELINRAPPCAGMESFKESIITLTRHNDAQVQQIARSFRDKWIPRTIRRINYSDRDDSKFESQGGHSNRFSVPHKRWHDQSVRQTDAIVCIGEPTPMPNPPDAERPEQMSLLPTQLGTVASSIDSNPTDGTKRKRKRKSRWDQPADTNLDVQPSLHIEDQISNLKVGSGPHQHETSEVLHDQTTEIQRVVNCKDDAEREHINDDAPPGFSSPLKNAQAPSDAAVSGLATNCSPEVPNSSLSCEVVVAHSQKRFLPHMPVSYGIPLALVQQLGTPNEEASGGWLIAMGVPFHPFPPLPTYPRGQPNPSLQPLVSASNRVVHGIGEEAQRANLMEPNIPSAASVARPQDSAAVGANHVDANIPGAASVARPQDAAARVANAETNKRMKWSPSNGLGRRYFRQQKWNGRVGWMGPPWLRPWNGWGPKGSCNMRNGVSNMGGVGNEMREAGGLCHTGSVNNCSNGIKNNSTFYQSQQH